MILIYYMFSLHFYLSIPCSLDLLVEEQRSHTCDKNSAPILAVILKRIMVVSVTPRPANVREDMEGTMIASFTSRV